MLVQEHIAHLLNQSVPENWEREIRLAYTDPWGDTPRLEANGKDGEVKQNALKDGQGMQKKEDAVADGTDNEKRTGTLNESSADMKGSLNTRSHREMELEHEDEKSETESMRSEDTEHSSSSEGEYR
jgi:hypothetical protein